MNTRTPTPDQTHANNRTTAATPRAHTWGRACILIASLATLLGMAPPATAQSIYNGASGSQQWSDAGNWSAGVPDPTIDAQIRNTQTIVLPSAIGSAATARSLSVFDTTHPGIDEEHTQDLRLEGGTLNLTPAAIESLRVGIANPLSQGLAVTRLYLDDATLTSTGFAQIGVGLPAGADGELVGMMFLQQSAQWLHSSGLIELGGGNGRGRLGVDTGSLLAGSLLPGVGLDPRVKVNHASNFFINPGGTARLSEVSVNADVVQGVYSGLMVYGSLETNRLVLGENSTGGADFFKDSDSRLGDVTVNQSSHLDMVGATAQADSIVVGNGRIYVGQKYFNDGLIPSQLTIGTPGSPDTLARPFILADVSGTTASLLVEGSNVTVHGDAALGQFGHATVDFNRGGVLDIRGTATLGKSDSVSAGSGHATVTGPDAVLRAQNLEVGYSYFDTYGASNPYPSPTGSISVGAGGRVEIAVLSGTATMFLPGFGSVTSPVNYAGSLTIGKNGTLDLLDASGLVVFNDAPDGGVLTGEARVTNYGTIKGGGAGPGGGPNIDFGAAGGTLENLGTIDVGHSPGWLTVKGNVSFEGWDAGFFHRLNGRLVIELGGTNAGFDYDVFEILGDADFTGGILELSFSNGYTPAAGDSWDFLRVSGGYTGWFSSIVNHTGIDFDFSHGFEPDGTFRLTAPGSIGGGGSSVPERGASGLLLTVSLAGLLLIKRRPAEFKVAKPAP